MADEYVGVLYGNTPTGSGTSAVPKFRVACELQYTQEDSSKGNYFQKRYFVEVSTEPENTVEFKPSWGTVAIPIDGIGEYAISEWIDVGWKKKGTTIDCSCSGTITVDGVTYKSSVTSKYTVSVTRYTVTYDANGGTNAPSSQYFDKGSSVTLRTGVPMLKGYHFVYWNTQQDGRGVAFKPGDKYAQNADLTLYAIWEVKKVEVIFNNLNPITGKITDTISETYTYGRPERPFPTVDWQVDGYTLEGWSISPTDLKKNYSLTPMVTDEWIDQRPDTKWPLYTYYKPIASSIGNLRVKVNGAYASAINGFVKVNGDYTNHNTVGVFVKSGGTYHNL